MIVIIVVIVIVVVVVVFGVSADFFAVLVLILDTVSDPVRILSLSLSLSSYLSLHLILFLSHLTLSRTVGCILFWFLLYNSDLCDLLIQFIFVNFLSFCYDYYYCYCCCCLCRFRCFRRSPRPYADTLSDPVSVFIFVLVSFPAPSLI